MALAHSPDRDGMGDFAEPITGVLEELKLHGSYAKKWGVRLDETVPAEATLAYSGFLLSTAVLRGVCETCAAMTPCMRLYAFLGRSLAEKGYDQDNPNGEVGRDLLRLRLRGPRRHARTAAGPLC